MTKFSIGLRSDTSEWFQITSSWHHRKPWKTLTCLVGGYSHRDRLFRSRTLLGDPIDGPDLEGVVGMSLQVIYGHAGGAQTQLLGGKMDAVATGLTALAVRVAALAYDVIRQVLSAAAGRRSRPLQIHRSLVHVGDQVLRRRRGFWKENFVRLKNPHLRDMTNLRMIYASFLQGWSLKVWNKQNWIMSAAEIALQIHRRAKKTSMTPRRQTNTHPYTPFYCHCRRAVTYPCLLVCVFSVVFL